MYISGVFKSNKLVCSVQMDNGETLCGPNQGRYNLPRFVGNMAFMSAVIPVLYSCAICR